MNLLLVISSLRDNSQLKAWMSTFKPWKLLAKTAASRKWWQPNIVIKVYEMPLSLDYSATKSERGYWWIRPWILKPCSRRPEHLNLLCEVQSLMKLPSHPWMQQFLHPPCSTPMIVAVAEPKAWFFCGNTIALSSLPVIRPAWSTRSKSTLLKSAEGCQVSFSCR